MSRWLKTSRRRSETGKWNAAAGSLHEIESADSLAVQMAAVMKATSSARRKVAAASDVKIISYYLNNLKKHTQKDFIINESHRQKEIT